MSEKNYIRYRKAKAFLNRICFMLCRIFPIKRNRISICTFEGKGGFGCHPKYIVEELHRRNENHEFIWFVNDMDKEFPSYIKKVPNTLWSRAYWLSTSKIWIDNYRKPYGSCKRKGQYYVNTWHGNVAFKSIGLWRGKAFSEMAYLVSRNDSDMIDSVVVDSTWCEKVYPKGLLYRGGYLRTGAPRCDVLHGNRDRYREMFRQKHGIDKDAKIVMYAPTFRESSRKGKRTVFSGNWTLDFMGLLKALERRFGGAWYLCIRLHPQLSESFKGRHDTKMTGKLIDVSREDDMYEILAAMDAMVTDYSSAAMDASYAHMPVFIYADDLEEYVNRRGDMMWNMSPHSKAPVTSNKDMTPDIDAVLPYPVAQNNEELEENILGFDEQKYLWDMEKFEKAIGLIFDGKASARVADRLERYMAQ